MHIMIHDYVKSDTAVSYDDGKRCYEDILKHIDDDIVVLDFQGVDFVITAFLNPVIGDLILQKGRQIMVKVEIANANKNIMDKIKMVVEGSLLKREDMSEV